MKVDTKTFTTDSQWTHWLRDRKFGKYLAIRDMDEADKHSYILDLEARLIEIYKVIDKMESK